MKTYNKRTFRRQTAKRITQHSETADAILWDIDWLTMQARVKIQGSDEYVIAYFPRNEATIPRWLKPGNAVRILHRAGERGYCEIIGHGMAIPTPVPGSASHPDPGDLADGIVSGCEITATSPASMAVEIADGTYRINGQLYSLSAGAFGYPVMSATSPILMRDPYSTTMGQNYNFYTMSASLGIVMNGIIPQLTLGAIVYAYTLDPAPTGTNHARYDTFQVGTDGIIDYIKGVASTNPSKPAISADHVQLAPYILLYQGMTVINQSNIGMEFTARQPATLEISAIDEFDYDFGDSTPQTNVLVQVRDQYGWLLSGTYTFVLNMIVGSGQIYSGQSGWQTDTVQQDVAGGSGYTFIYERDQTTNESSPIFMATLSGVNSQAVFHRITLLNMFDEPIPSGGLNALYQVLTSATNITVDWSIASSARVTASHDITFAFSNALDGQKLMLMIRQDSTGGRTFTFPSSVKYSDVLTSITVSPDANDRSYIGFIYDATSGKYDCVANQSGYQP